MIDYLLVKGHIGGANFWAYPVRFKSDKTEDIQDPVADRDIGITTDEESCEFFLWHFLVKYFDGKLLYNRFRELCCNGEEVEFEWYLTDNYYPRDTIKTMLADIGRFTADLEKNGLDAVFAEIKDDRGFGSCYGHSIAKVSREELEEYRATAIEYYRRFVQYMNDMLESGPDYPYISFQGP